MSASTGAVLRRFIEVDCSASHRSEREASAHGTATVNRGLTVVPHTKRLRPPTFCILTAALLPGKALAHDSSRDWTTAAPWTFEPWVLACLTVAALLYVGGAWKVWRKAGMGRGLTVAHAAAFAGGWLILVAALVSPLDGLGAHLFSAHMLQHELLMVIAAPLFVLSRPLEAWTWGLPAPWRSGPA